MKNQTILHNTNDDESKPHTTKPNTNLTLENYATFFNDPTNNSHLTYLHFSQILQMHGFCRPSKNQRRKTIIAEAVGAIDNLMNPNRSTLTSSSTEITTKKSSLSIDEVDNDLEALQWKDMSVQTFRFFAFEDDEYNNADDIGVGNGNGGGRLVEKSCGDMVEKRKVKRRKVKQRIVFDPVFATKPRSKMKRNQQKRRSIREITLSSCFV